jgi:hypothetical protein
MAGPKDVLKNNRTTRRGLEYNRDRENTNPDDLKGGCLSHMKKGLAFHQVILVASLGSRAPLYFS